MKDKLITIVTLSIKGLIVYSLLGFSLKYYRQDLPFYVQSPLIWIFAYLPVFMGYESLISVIFSRKNKGNKVDNPS